MSYLLDSNSFIQPKNTFYSFAGCPSFWDWLIQANRRGCVYSVLRVERELKEQEDELSKWVDKCGDNFFLAPDNKSVPDLQEVAQWVQDHAAYTDAARQEFFRKADYYLIAQARTLGFKVVTFEKHENSIHRVKIPTVCDGVGVKHCNLFEMLNAEGASF